MGQVTGVVTRVEAGRARVECGISNHPACGTCAAGRGCGWQRSNQPRRLEIDAQQGMRTLAPGDRLEVRIDDARPVAGGLPVCTCRPWPGCWPARPCSGSRAGSRESPRCWRRCSGCWPAGSWPGDGRGQGCRCAGSGSVPAIPRCPASHDCRQRSRCTSATVVTSATSSCSIFRSTTRGCWASSPRTTSMPKRRWPRSSGCAFRCSRSTVRWPAKAGTIVTRSLRPSGYNRRF